MSYDISYNPETGVISRFGKEAGYIMNTGYREIYYQGRRWLAHRLAWYLYYGVEPTQHIDHINGDRLDNRIENLRDVSRSVNLRNQRKIRGYHKFGDRFRAQYSLDNVIYHIGLKEQARKAYENAIANL